MKEDVDIGEKEISKYAQFLLGTGDDGEMQSD